jgi:hypothetical protein
MARKFSMGTPFSPLSNVTSLNSDLPIAQNELAGATWIKAKA